MSDELYDKVDERIAKLEDDVSMLRNNVEEVLLKIKISLNMLIEEHNKDV